VIFRVATLKTGNEGEIIATCLQDVFGLPAANYATQKGESLYSPPDYSAKPITPSRLIEMPYHVMPFILSEAEMSFVKQTDSFIWSLGAQPTALSINYEMAVNAGGGYISATRGSFTPFVRLEGEITPYQTQLKFALEGDYPALDSAYALMINEEIVKIESVDFSAGTMIVGRGCADTIPQGHKAGAIAWCYLLGAGINEIKYTAGEHLKVKLLTHTAQQTLDASKAPELAITTRQRQARPYPPGKVQINGIYGNKITDSSAFKLTWAHRDRDVQADKLIPHTDGSTSQDKAVSYKVDLMDGDTLVRSITTTGTEFVYPDAKRKAGEQFSRVALYSVKGGLTSLQRYLFEIGGVMVSLYKFNYQAKFNKGDEYLNRYDDGYFGGKGYFMLSGSADPSTEIYKDYPVTPGKYTRFVLDYKVLTYYQRRGKCKVLVQLLAGKNVVRTYDSGLLGDYPDEAWRDQQVTDNLPANVNIIRFKIVAQNGLETNALTFRDITIRAGSD